MMVSIVKGKAIKTDAKGLSEEKVEMIRMGLSNDGLSPGGITSLNVLCDSYTALAERLKAKDTALEFAHAAIDDAIGLDDGIDGETGRRVQRIIIEALEQGTLDQQAHGDFLSSRERQRQTEQDRERTENFKLWAVFKTCHGCKSVVPGVLDGCPIQQHIDLSGHCNQYEAKP